MAEKLEHHFNLISCEPEYTVADFKLDVVEWQMHPLDICLTESECILKIKIKLNMNSVN